MEKLGLEFPVLSDPSAEVVSAYGVLHSGGGMGGTDIARPAEFLVGPDGGIRWRELTENWRVRVRPEEIIEAVRREPLAAERDTD